MWPIIASALGIPLLVFESYIHLIKPRLRREKLRRVYALAEDWFDYIDRHLDAGVDRSQVASLEGKVTTFLQDHALSNVPMAFDSAFRTQFLAEVGVRPELRDDTTLFSQYSRIHGSTMTLEDWWLSTQGAAWRFLADYDRAAPETNWADVQMRLKVLKQFTGAKAQ